MFASSQSQITFNSGLASTAWCAARQRAFLKPPPLWSSLLTGHRQKRLLQRQFHMRIGQRFLGPPQFAAQPGGFIYFISFFHANDLTISCRCQTAAPTASRVSARL